MPHGSRRKGASAARENAPQGSGRPRNQAAPVYGAIDLGTNNCRLLIASAVDGAPRGCKDGLRVIDAFSRIVRLGEELGASGRLSEEAMARTIKALKVCADKINRHGVRRSHAIATEACRQAENGEEFLHRVNAETGLVMQTITPIEEAELTLAGCTPLLNTGHDRVLMLDIGGGSTELMWVEADQSKPPRALDILSLPFGVVNLAEEYGHDTLAPEDYEQVVGRIDAALQPFEERNAICAEIEAGRVQVLGTSGTVTTFGAIYLDLASYDRSRVDGLSIRVGSIRAIAAKIAGMDTAARQAHPCIGPGRADLMIMGCAVITAICRRWQAANLTAADRGIREGLLLSMMAEDQMPAHG